MTTVAVAPYSVASFPEAGGHFWVYIQSAAALAALGCDVYWLEQFRPSGDKEKDSRIIKTFLSRMRDYGFDQKVLLYEKEDLSPKCEFITMERAKAEEIIKRTELLFNFHYAIDPELLSKFHKTALVDIDPGLLQFWASNHQLSLPRHDFYFTTGETVGTSKALFPDCGLPWVYVPPGVFLDLWPYVYDASCELFTTVSSWWGKEYVTDGKEILYENNKRVSFLEFLELPRHTPQPLELALSFGDDEVEERQRLEQHGWRVKHAFSTANGPLAYQTYIQRSRGEFSCAKPSCMKFQNAWISDRTLCYLATGKPAVVQDTGPSSFLPNGEGLFRFSTIDDAARAFEIINRSYEKNCRTARAIAEEYFDARKSMKMMLETAL
jgi:hypothetical protein